MIVFNNIGNEWYAPVKINGVKVNCVLDTGASYTVIPEGVLLKCYKDISYFKRNSKKMDIQVTDASKKPLSLRKALLHNLCFKTFRLQSLYTVVALNVMDDSQILLGHDFINFCEMHKKIGGDIVLQNFNNYMYVNSHLSDHNTYLSIT